MVNGLNKNLMTRCLATEFVVLSRKKTYNAATTEPLHLLSFLGDVKSAEDPASPESAIVIKAFALRRSTAIYRRYVKTGHDAKLGRSEKSGSRSGAW